MYRLSVPSQLVGLITRAGEPIVVVNGYCDVLLTEDKDDLVARGCTVVAQGQGAVGILSYRTGGAMVANAS